MNQPTTLQQMQQRPAHHPAPVAMSFFDLQGFELMQRIAKAFSQSGLVPDQYQGNLPNCMIALDMAQRIGANPLQVMQNLVIVHQRPTWSSQFLIATVNSSGRFSALRFEFFGEQGTDTWGCRAWAIEKATGEKLIGADITIAIAKAEGWYDKKGSKWRTMPQQMLMYRAGSWWTRAFAPELSMGLHTAEEVGDVYEARGDGSGGYSVNLDTLRTVEPATQQAAQQEALEHEEAEVVDTLTGEILQAEPEPAQQQAKSQAQQQAATMDGLSFE